MKKAKTIKKMKKMRSRRGASYDYGSKSITPWGYVGRNILYSIPVIGWIIWFTRLFAKNRNVRNHARSFFCAFILSLIVSVAASLAIIAVEAFGIASAAEITDAIKGITDTVQGAL